MYNSDFIANILKSILRKCDIFVQVCFVNYYLYEVINMLISVMISSLYTLIRIMKFIAWLVKETRLSRKLSTLARFAKRVFKLYTTLLRLEPEKKSK